MHIVVMGLCVIAMMFIRAHLADLKAPYRTRGSLRYQRRRARQLGIHPDLVDVRYRSSGHHDWGEPTGESHVGDLKWGFKTIIATIVVAILGVIAFSPIDLGPEWIMVTLLGALIVSRVRAAKYRRLKAQGAALTSLEG